MVGVESTEVGTEVGDSVTPKESLGRTPIVSSVVRWKHSRPFFTGTLVSVGTDSQDWTTHVSLDLKSGGREVDTHRQGSSGPRHGD